MNEFVLELVEVNNAQLGFSILIIIVAVAWNLNWKHFIRYWLRHRPYKRRSILLMRMFFGASLVGTIWTLIETIVLYDWNFRSIGISIIDTLIILIPVLLFDLFARWHMGPPIDSDFESKPSE